MYWKMSTIKGIATQAISGSKIKNRNMDTKELKIEIPEGYEIDKEKSTFEKIVFKKTSVNIRPQSWEDYVNNFKKKFLYTVDYTDKSVLYESCGRYNEFLRSDECKAFIALGKLVQLRDAWIGDFYDDLMDQYVPKYGIIYDCPTDDFVIKAVYFNTVLSFPTEEMAENFKITFEDLMRQARMFL